MVLGFNKFMEIGIVDYGTGNVSSLLSMIKTLNYSYKFTKDIKILNKSDVILLPGVGSFNSAINQLLKDDLFENIKSFYGSKKIIGICLGMQLLAESSTENGLSNGFGLIPGYVKQIKNNRIHVGWNQIKTNLKESSLKIFDGEHFYFNHSYEFITEKKYKYFVSDFDYEISSIVANNNVIGIQFHPEKSQMNGINLFKKIVEEF